LLTPWDFNIRNTSAACSKNVSAVRPMNIDCKMYSFEKGYIEHRDRTPVQLLFGK
jgi:hypothetical protein